MDNKQELKENKEARDELENFYLLKIRQEQDTEQKILLIEDMARYLFYYDMDDNENKVDEALMTSDITYINNIFNILKF